MQIQMQARTLLRVAKKQEPQKARTCSNLSLLAGIRCKCKDRDKYKFKHKYRLGQIQTGTNTDGQCRANSQQSFAFCTFSRNPLHDIALFLEIHCDAKTKTNVNSHTQADSAGIMLLCRALFL